MNQLKRTTAQFYIAALETYNDDELSRYVFDLESTFDAIEKRITELHNENVRSIVNMDGTVEKFNGEY